MVAGEPQFALLTKDIENLALNILKIRISRLSSVIGNVELEETSS